MRYFSAFAESLFFAYQHGPDAFRRARSATITSLDDAASRERDISAIDLAAAGIACPQPGPGSLGPQFEGRHHVLVPQVGNRRATSAIVRHGWGSPIPPHALALVGPGIYMSTPEFTFLQLQRVLDPIGLALVGCVLCARYFVNRRTGKPQQREPLTSVERIGAFLDGSRGVRGVAGARRALALVADGAESPQEVNLFLMMSLPPDLGGRGIKGLSLNYKIDVEEEDAPIVDRPDRASVRIDMGVPGLHVGAEYLGKHHDAQVDSDRARQNFLLAKGERVLQAKYADIADPVKAERLANQLGRMLGLPAERPSATELLARHELAARLFGTGRPQL